MKQVYEVRRDTIEHLIVFYDAKGDFGGGRALRRLARDSGVPLDEEKIRQQIEDIRKQWSEEAA